MRFSLLAVAVLMVSLCLVSVDLAQEKGKTQNPAPPPLPPGVKALRDLEYVKGGHERQRLDLYLPDKITGPLPVVVWIHGGGWRGGSKEGCRAMPFAVEGYAVASINYRLSQHATFPAQIEDCKAAIRWLRAHAKEYDLDPKHIGVWGASAGGHLVALLGTSGGVKELEGNLGNPDQSSRVQAVCDWFGPADFTRIAGKSADADSAIGRLLGGPIQDNKEKAKLASPVTFISKENPPFLIMHGDMDKTVPLSQSEALAEALKKAGVDATLVVLKGAGHGGNQFTSPQTRQSIREFFDKHLKKTAKNS
jgi:acetyl esterase/lipase